MLIFFICYIPPFFSPGRVFALTGLKIIVMTIRAGKFRKRRTPAPHLMRPTVFRKTAAANNIDTASADHSSQRHKICSVHIGSPVFRQRLQKLYTFSNNISIIFERTVLYREQAVLSRKAFFVRCCLKLMTLCF